MRFISILFIATVVMVTAFSIAQKPNMDQQADKVSVSRALDALHEAAAKADGKRYFALFAPDAVFIGTDASERWPIKEFRNYAMTRFKTGTGWTYHLKAGQRFVSISDDGSVAWFDELLENAKYGTCRGSGVLRKIDHEWKISQYNLSIPIPNDLAGDVVTMIKEKSAVQP